MSNRCQVEQPDRARAALRAETQLSRKAISADLDRSASGFAAGVAADQTSPSGRAEGNEKLSRMVDALSKIPALMREVVVMKHCQGMTLREIGGWTGRSVPAVTSLLRRGLEALRNQLITEE